MNDYGSYPYVLLLSIAFLVTGSFVTIVGLSFFLISPLYVDHLPVDVIVSAILLILSSILFYYSGIGLIMLKKNAFYISLVLACLCLLIFPIGTLVFGPILFGLYKIRNVFLHSGSENNLLENLNHCC